MQGRDQMSEAYNAAHNEASTVIAQKPAIGADPDESLMILEQTGRRRGGQAEILADFLEYVARVIGNWEGGGMKLRNLAHTDEPENRY